MANAIKGSVACFCDDKPDMLVLLGDRTEMLGIASDAMNERIPIAHIYGGEVTEGAVDDYIRHALTKMSYLHFTSTKVYRNDVYSIRDAIREARIREHTVINLCGTGNTSEQIFKINKTFLSDNQINLKKGFYDMVAKV